MSKRIDGQFAPRLIEMLESPAYRVLSRAAHQVLARIEIELAHHGGMDNGKLPVTYTQLVEYGLRRHAIATAIRELVTLGFIEITEQGRAGNADFRRPSKYRITYRHVGDRANPTHEWRQITEDDAIMIAKGARRPASNFANRKNRKPAPKTTPSPAPKTTPKPTPENDTNGSKISTIPLVTKTGLPLEGSPSTLEAQALQQKHEPSPPPDPWAGLDIPEYLLRR